MPSFERLIPHDQAGDFVTLKMRALLDSPANYNGTTFNPPAKAGKRPPLGGSLEEQLQAAHQRGYSAGYAQAEQDLQGLVNARATQLAPLLSAARDAMQQLQTEHAQQVLELAINLAEQIVRCEVKTHTAPLLKVVQEALSLLTENAGRISLYVHPSDAAAVRSELHEQTHLQVLEETAIAPGGCRLVTPQGEINATLAQRIEAARLALGLAPRLDGDDIAETLSQHPLV